MKALGKIPVISFPSGSAPRLLRRVVPEPLWDTEYMQQGQRQPLDFFTRCQGEMFALATAPAPERLKTPSDTSVQRKDGCPLLSQNRYLLSRVVLYPSTEGVKDLAAYREAVERLRQTATLEVCFGPSVNSTFPLRDAMPNFAGLDHEKRDDIGSSVAEHGDGTEIDFDPSEAPDLTFRRGVDVELHLAAPNDSEGAPQDHPLHILQKEDFRIRIVPHAGGEAVGIRCYLVGNHFRALQG